jgi:hypothetical protein
LNSHGDSGRLADTCGDNPGLHLHSLKGFQGR